MEAALVSASTGVLRPLLSKLTKLLGDEYAKLKGVRKQIKFLRDELSSMAATLQMLGEAEELNPVMKDWRDKLRELSYDIEDCIDSFIARVDHDHDDAPARLDGLFLKLKKLKARHEIANEIKKLKARAIEASDRHKRYNFSLADNSSSSSSTVDPRLAALYEDADRLEGIDDPKKQIIEWINMYTIPKERRVLPIVGSGGLGKTTLANQVYHSMKSKFWGITAFVSVSQNPDLRKVLRDIAQEMRITVNPDDDERQLIDKLRQNLYN